ncbi:hypothetical protein CFP66_35220 [Pseudonocardia sp. MH-G8]|nr:hypothetical protein CFP66_35220 [Pseudonocardia sp. MH-G8]
MMSVMVVVFLLLFGASTAGAQELAAPVDRVEVSTGSYRLELVMDRPLTAAQVARYEQELRGMLRHEQQVDGPVDMDCGAVFSPADENGRARIERICDRRQLRWTYRISSQVRMIIVGPVTETGLWYFINGVRQPRNSPHVEPSDYLFHGTMSGVDAGVQVDFQDYLTFRHNIGPGGAGSITFAGSARMV